MKQRWDQSILYLTTIAVLAIAVVIGALFIDAANRTTRERIQQQSVQRLGELLDTVERPATMACESNDRKLAQELVNGLVKNSGVLGVVIRTGSRELARNYHDDASTGELENAAVARVVRVIYSSTHPDRPVGEIQLDPDTVQLEQQAQQEMHFVGKLLGVQIAGTAAAIFLVLLIWIVRPIKALSDRLHSMNAAAGERLRIPRGHSHTELGRLAEDINALAGRLVTTLDEEHKLRVQHEIGEKKYHAIFANAETGIFIAGKDGRIESFNPALSRMLEVPIRPEQAGDTWSLPDLRWSNPGLLRQQLDACVSQKSTRSVDLEYILQNGSSRWLNLLFSSLGDERLQGVVSDVTERKQAENTARLQVVTDALTGVANRPGLEQALQLVIRKYGVASDAGFALLLVNLDGFKRVNEALGLPVGDAILQVAAKRLRGSLKPTDIVARVGGDEYVVVLPQATDESTAARIAERIISSLCRNYEVHTTPVHLGASLGVTFFPNDGRDIPTLLRNAELAMTRAKSAGGKRFTFFNLGMAEAAEQRRALEMDMHQALRRDEFKLYLQPIVDISRQRMVGAEALIRWHHPTNGIVPPDSFVPLAEETGLVISIGHWMLEMACRQLATWQSEGKDYYLSVNISGRQIPDGLSPETLVEAVQRHGVVPGRLVLEITEGILLSDVSKALSWLNAVSGAGFRIYLDDFGTGYSSLSYLKRFPVNTVKIDKSFVRDMNVNASDHALVAAIVAMAHSLNLDVVAEGVENFEQLKLLRQMNCRNIQGYYFSRPVQADDFVELGDAIAGRLQGIAPPHAE